MPVLATNRLLNYEDTTAGPTGTTGVFSSIAAAISPSGHKTIFVKEGTITESTSPSIIQDDIQIRGENRDACIWNLGTNLLIVSASNFSVENMTIQSSRDDVGGICAIFSGLRPTFRNCVFEFTHLSNPTNPMNFINDSGAITGVEFIDCVIKYSGNFTNQQFGINITNGLSEIEIRGLRAEGGGTNTKVLNVASGSNTISDVKSNFIPAVDAVTVSGNNNTISNVNGLGLALSGVGNLLLNYRTFTDATITGAFNRITNGIIEGDLTINETTIMENVAVSGATSFGANSGQSKFTDVTFTGAITDNASSSERKFVSCTFVQALSWLGDYDEFVAPRFFSTFSVGVGVTRLKSTGGVCLGGVTLDGDNNALRGLQAGANAGGGGATITVAATATNCIVHNCNTDVAIVDNGTGTSLVANTVY